MEKTRRRIWKILVPLLFFLAFLLSSGLSKGSNRLEKVEGRDKAVEINQDKLKQTILDLQSMGERSSWEKQKETSLYLQRRLKEKRFQPEIQVYEDNGRTWENITVTFPGNVNPDRKILAVAHYDSTNSVSKNDAPGADDNGSGVATLLELAEILRHKQNQNTVQLVFFSNEEKGQLGSKAFARKMKQEGVNIKSVINVDIVGYNNPTALFSMEIFSILSANFPIKRKAKIFGKMAYNFVTHIFNISKELKVMAREEGRHLIPDTYEANKEIGEDRVRWDVGNICV